MTLLFVSHSTADAGATTAVIELLRRAGYESTFVDFDEIAAGRDWEREIYAALRRSQAVVILCSKRAIESRWCFAEIAMARSLGKEIFPVRIDACGEHPLLRDRQWVDLVDDWDDGARRLLAGLRRSGLDPADSFDWDPRRCPYPGLAPFEAADAAVYFGRGDAIRDALDLTNRLARSGNPRLGVLVGASGTGKSSLVRAGVLPRLRKDPARWRTLAPVRPKDAPFDAITRALIAERQPHSPDWEATVRATLGAAIADAPSGAGLVDVARRLTLEAGTPEAIAVLVLDQLEDALSSTRHTA